MTDVTELLARLREYIWIEDDAADDVAALCDAHESLRGMFYTLTANVASLIDQRNSTRAELEGAKLQIADLQQRLAAGQTGLGIASTASDDHAVIREKIRQGLVDQQKNPA